MIEKEGLKGEKRRGEGAVAGSNSCQ